MSKHELQPFMDEDDRQVLYSAMDLGGVNDYEAADRYLNGEKCPKCPDERLVRILGNLLTCPSCEVILVDA